jgi:predicted RNA-binding Zn-ribbon protein involved in translation (DUF1610 family)
MSPHDTAADKSIGSFTNAGSKTYLRRLRNKLRRLTSGSEPDVEAAIENPRVLVEEIVRRDVDPSLTLLGTRRRGAVEHRWPADTGYGELCSAAYDEIRDRLDLAAIAPGTHVATVLVDLEAWDYQVVLTDCEDSEPTVCPDGGLKRPPTQGFVEDDEAGQYVVCAGVDARMRSCGGRMRLDEADSDAEQWTWRCPDCGEALIQVRRANR